MQASLPKVINVLGQFIDSMTAANGQSIVSYRVNLKPRRTARREAGFDLDTGHPVRTVFWQSFVGL